MKKLEKLSWKKDPYNFKYTYTIFIRIFFISFQVKFETIYVKRLVISNFVWLLMRYVMSPKESKWLLSWGLLIKMGSWESVFFIWFMLETQYHWLLKRNYALFFLEIVLIFIIFAAKDMMVLEICMENGTVCKH